MDLTQYGASPYADPRNRQQVQGFLPSLLRGFLGREEQGSVLEPGAQEARSTNNLGQGASVLNDLLPYGAAAKAAKAAGGIAGMFVGQGAKTWDALAAARAVELLRKGVPATEVQRLTNTARFPDGFLRQEISDDKTSLRKLLTPDADYEALSKALHHPGLMAAYPDLANKPVRLRLSPEAESVYRGSSIDVSAPHETTARDLLLHELQHDIQLQEGFARGGSPAEFYKDAAWLAQKTGKPREWALEKAFKDYERLGGEAEARLVEARQPLSSKARRNTPYAWDVDPHVQILRYHR